jgi:hypothetical protein
MRQNKLVGQTFGRLKVLSKKDSNNGDMTWLCKCSCGKNKIIRGMSLKDGSTRSCGCLRLETLRTNGLTHGHTRAGGATRIYRIWHGMSNRCNNPNNKDYFRYGGRGIKVCKRWSRFENFLKDMGEPNKNLSIERKNNDRGYSPSNCKWATSLEQNNNRALPGTYKIDDRSTDLRLKRIYGISLIEYNDMLIKQDGVCKICFRPPRSIRLAVDHDHRADRIKIYIKKAPNNSSNSPLWSVSFESLLVPFEFLGSKKDARAYAKRKLRRVSVRGLLCMNCNRGLQKFYDKPERFEAAAKYLRDFESKWKNEETTPAVGSSPICPAR